MGSFRAGRQEGRWHGCPGGGVPFPMCCSRVQRWRPCSRFFQLNGGLNLSGARPFGLSPQSSGMPPIRRSAAPTQEAELHIDLVFLTDLFALAFKIFPPFSFEAAALPVCGGATVLLCCDDPGLSLGAKSDLACAFSCTSPPVLPQGLSEPRKALDQAGLSGSPPATCAGRTSRDILISFKRSGLHPE